VKAAVIRDSFTAAPTPGLTCRFVDYNLDSTRESVAHRSSSAPPLANLTGHHHHGHQPSCLRKQLLVEQNRRVFDTLQAL
jgi:hypothetical protein